MPTSAKEIRINPAFAADARRTTETYSPEVAGIVATIEAQGAPLISALTKGMLTGNWFFVIAMGPDGPLITESGSLNELDSRPLKPSNPTTSPTSGPETS